MGDSMTGSFLLLSAVALLLFRPKDVPMLARNAGRIVGVTVRSMKKMRDIADAAVQKGAKESTKNPGLAKLGQQLRSSYSIFSDLASTVRRDMADVPISPVSYLRSRMRASSGNASTAVGQFDADPASAQLQIQPKNPKHDSSAYEPPPLSSATANGPSSVSNFTSSNQPPAAAGADFIARSIQEAALAEQKRKILGQSEHEQSQSHQQKK